MLSPSCQKNAPCVNLNSRGGRFLRAREWCLLRTTQHLWACGLRRSSSLELRNPSRARCALPHSERAALFSFPLLSSLTLASDDASDFPLLHFYTPSSVSSSASRPSFSSPISEEYRTPRATIPEQHPSGNTFCAPVVARMSRPPAVENRKKSKLHALARCRRLVNLSMDQIAHCRRSL